MNKKGKAISSGLVWVVAIALVALVGLGSYAIFFKPAPQSGLATGNAALTPAQSQQAAFACGDNKQTTVSLTLKNALNTTAAETFDANYVIYQIQSDGKETQIASGSDTTAGSQTLDCGSKYRFKLLAGAAVNSRATGVYTQNAEVDKDGSVIFTTTAPTLTLGVTGSRHSSIEVRAYNEDARARMFEAAGSSTAYVGTGADFFSTSDNVTAQTVTAGSSMLMTVELKNVDVAGDFNDYGTYVLFDAANTYWDKIQQVTFDGTDLSEVKSQLNPEETKKFANYEFVYAIPQGKLIDGKSHKLYFDALKSTGAIGTDSLKVDFAVKGNYLSVDGYTVKTAAAKDSSTNPVVFPMFQTSFETQ